MKAAFPFALMICVSVLANAQTSRPTADLTVVQLIDRLQDVSNAEYQVSTNIIAVGNGKPLPQGLKMMQDPGPRPAEVMAELVGRGAASLPDLCAHLDDARKTKASVKGMRGLTFSAEYDWNPRTGKQRPVGVDTRDTSGIHAVRIVGHPDNDTYTLAVGDLCFEIIGKIVDRQFLAVRYQPSAILYVNSPVLCPPLAAAVRQEWGKLTAAQHRQILIADVATPDQPWRANMGVNVLEAYYPDAVETAVRARLNLPLYDRWTVEQFIDHDVLPDGDAASRLKKIQQFAAAHGSPCMDGMVMYLWPYRDTPIWGDWKAQPAIVLQQLIGKFDPDYPPLVTAVDSNWEFIDSLVYIDSPKIDAIVYDQFRSHSGHHSGEMEDDDYVALACAARLRRSGHVAEFDSYYKRRISEMKNKESRDNFPYVLGDMNKPTTDP